MSLWSIYGAWFSLSSEVPPFSVRPVMRVWVGFDFVPKFDPLGTLVSSVFSQASLGKQFCGFRWRPVRQGAMGTLFVVVRSPDVDVNTINQLAVDLPAFSAK